MARRTAILNGEHVNGDGPPPSTLAAQLVHNQHQARQATNHASVEKDGFRELLHEILHNHDAVQETDVHVNAHLITVVAQAGLEPLTYDNPFVDHDALMQSAVDSISVITRTVQRQPEVLLLPVTSGGPQAVLGLFATLFAVCGRARCQDLAIPQLLSLTIRALNASFNYWQCAHTVQQLIQECVDDILSSLESLSTSPVFSVSIPPARQISRFWPDSESSITVPPGTQKVLADADAVPALVTALRTTQCPDLGKAWQQEAGRRIARLAVSLRPRLEKAEAWATVVRQLLQTPHPELQLAQLLPNAHESSAEMQMLVARTMLDALRQPNAPRRDLLLPALHAIVQAGSIQNLHEDLKIAITAWFSRFERDSDVPHEIVALRDALGQDTVMSDSDLAADYQQLSVTDRESPTNTRARARKRRRVLVEEQETATVTQRIEKLLAGTESQDLGSLADVAPPYSTLNDDDKCDVWQCLASLAGHDLPGTLRTTEKLLAVKEQSRRPRVLSMLAIHACVAQTEDPNYAALESQFGRLCLASLQSSIRELRIAAGQALSSFIRSSLPKALRDQNCALALTQLRILSDRNIASELETVIYAWSSVVLACSDTDKEINLALLQLVEYLGHPSPLVCALAFAELEKIAIAKDRSPEELLRPFWRSISVAVVQDLLTKPQKVQQLCDLLGKDVNQFLLSTQLETLPTLVLTKRKDILQRLANARGNGSTIEDICLQPRLNLAAALSMLLMQPGSSAEAVEESAFHCLTEVAPGFKQQDTDLSTLVKMDPVLIACEMLKLCGDETQKRKSRAVQGFHIFASLAERDRGQRKAPQTKSTKHTAKFLEDKLLAILTQFSSSIASVAAQSVTEKLRCLKGIAEMITLTKGSVSHALPQIKACLQSGIEQPELCQTAYRAWLTLLGVLESDDIPSIVDETFVLIVRHWSTSLTPGLHAQTHQVIGDLVKAHNKVLMENMMTLPSLAGIPLLSKIAGEFDRLRQSENMETYFRAYSRRLSSDSSAVVMQALVELVPFLEARQEYIHDIAAAGDSPGIALTDFIRALLDATVKYSKVKPEAAELCGKALGIVGSLDPNRVEAPRKKRQVMVLSNFEKASEVIDWTLTLLEDVLVGVFKSDTNARSQGFLAHAMQELLRFCKVNEGEALPRTRASQGGGTERWDQMPEHVRTTLIPFLDSKYHIISTNTVSAPKRTYPSFSPDMSHSRWLRSVTYDLMFKGKGDNAQMIFPLLARIIRGQDRNGNDHDLAIARFVFPYAVLTIVLGGTVAEVKGLSDEFLTVLTTMPGDDTQRAAIRLCSESIFDLLDYMSTWLMEKKKALAQVRTEAYKTGMSSNEFDEAKDMGQIDSVEQFLASIPAEIVANSAVECGSFARALFHWEQFIRKKRSLVPSGRGRTTADDERLYGRLLDIYSEIDEPDGLEGVSAHLSIITEEQQTINHQKAGRWTAAQAWYELQLADNPGDIPLQYDLLRCLRETGRHAPLLRYADSFLEGSGDDAEHAEAAESHLPLATEACWMTDDFAGLRARLEMLPAKINPDFNIGVGTVLLHIQDGDLKEGSQELRRLRKVIAEGMSRTGTETLQACHREMFRLNVLHEIDALTSASSDNAPQLLQAFEKRLAALGSYTQDKQFILGVRRAVMTLRSDVFEPIETGSLWLTTARLARQTKDTENAYNAVLRAFDQGDKAAKLEEARLLWHDGHQRQAIQSIEAAINSGAFDSEDRESEMRPVEISLRSESTVSLNGGHRPNPLLGKALLLLAKWLDASGQSQTKDMTARYQAAARSLQHGERGYYYLSKHYNKLLDAQKALPPDKRSLTFATGDMTKVVLDNSLRSLPFGSKYWHETIPRLLTLWLELGTNCLKKAPKEDQATFDKRLKTLHLCNRQIQKYFERVQAYVFYHALPQLISRITHSQPDVWKQLSNMLTRIASTHPSQVLWSLLAVVKAADKARVERGTEILNRLRDPKARPTSRQDSSLDLGRMITHGQRLSDGLLQACEEPVEPRAVTVSLSKQLRFNLKLAPSNLVVPIEATLNARSPPVGSTGEQIKKYKAFAQDKITIQSFEDSVLVLSSLQRPRKITVRGSDGKRYGLLCKPKDDLRKDQRLMEFNGIINRALKRDTESSKRRLYIKTYAVTPLSEESGTIEWVEGIKPIRDILLAHYARRAIRPNYNELRKKMDEASLDPANAHIYVKLTTEEFPPVLHEWFTETYPEPESWFAARLRYARSAAVMSMTGHMLGLGDRHGENILLEEGSGGVFHVDFNCLFDKGLTFEKPEMVPFRLTPNMVDAMGPYGYEGPFRKCCELTLNLLRQERDTLMTVLETFLYDPTTDFVGPVSKKKRDPNVPGTPAEVLESVSVKLKGLLRGETVPLSVEGYVDALVQEATSPFRLASMYIGWCSFL